MLSASKNWEQIGSLIVSTLRLHIESVFCDNLEGVKVRMLADYYLSLTSTNYASNGHFFNRTCPNPLYFFIQHFQLSLILGPELHGHL